MAEIELLERTSNPLIFGGKPIIRGRRLAVEHILGMLAACERTFEPFTVETKSRDASWLRLGPHPNNLRFVSLSGGADGHR